DSRTLTIGGRVYDEPMDVLQTPGRRGADGGLHQFASQPIEQFRMRRFLDASAEILRRCHQTLAEILLPDSVHDHARGCWARWTGDPFSEAEPITRGIRGHRVKHRRHTG